MRLNRHAMRAIREASGLNQVDLARELGSSPGYINDLEGGRRNASAKKIREIADALRVPVTAIVELPSAVEKAS